MVIVTGASRGIGKAVAERLIQKKKEVIGIARDINKIPFRSYSCDVAQASEVQAVAKKIQKEILIYFNWKTIFHPLPTFL